MRDFISPVARLVEGRAVDRRNWHITLAYIGDFPERRSGAHRNDCFLISNIPLKRQTTTTVAPKLIDIAPTIYDLLSVEQPGYFDGRALLG